ncbi:hypothetical protein KXW21_006099, partial [Aspergillus fumigatus]
SRMRLHGCGSGRWRSKAMVRTRRAAGRSASQQVRRQATMQATRQATTQATTQIRRQVRKQATTQATRQATTQVRKQASSLHRPWPSRPATPLSPWEPPQPSSLNARGGWTTVISICSRAGTGRATICTGAGPPTVRQRGSGCS